MDWVLLIVVIVVFDGLFWLLNEVKVVGLFIWIGELGCVLYVCVIVDIVLFKIVLLFEFCFIKLVKVWFWKLEYLLLLMLYNMIIILVIYLDKFIMFCSVWVLVVLVKNGNSCL